MVLFARTSKAAARLAQQFRDGTIAKSYLAILEGRPATEEGEFVDWLAKDSAANRVRVAKPRERGAKQSHLRYRVRQFGDGRTLVEVRPLTGRSHQIRVQFAARGMPIVGDRKYGARRGLGGKIALHSASLQFRHPSRDETLTVTAPQPEYFDELLNAGNA